MALGSGPLIGLDIGSSAVRAAHVVSTRGGRSIQRFGQVALPHGAVIGGIVRDADAVSSAIQQLWKRAKFKSKSVVVGVANQRVVVRRVELPYIDEKELRSSLQYQVAEHIPMPVEEAQLDFQVVGENETSEGDRVIDILLVAAATEMVEGLLAPVRSAGLDPAGVDLTAFAIARAVSPAARGETGIAGSEAIVDIGAGVTNIVVHRGGEPAFVRILLVGGDDVTAGLMQRLDVPHETAEAMKLDLGSGIGDPTARSVLENQVETLVREIQGSLDYHLSQEGAVPITSLVLSGGGSLTPGLIPGLENVLGIRVTRAAPMSDADTKRSRLTSEQIAQVEPMAAAAVGLAMGAGR